MRGLGLIHLLLRRLLLLHEVGLGFELLLLLELRSRMSTVLLLHHAILLLHVLESLWRGGLVWLLGHLVLRHLRHVVVT